MTDGNDSKSITKSTSISIALVLALCGGAFWTGTLATRVSAVESDTRRLEELTEEIAKLASSNKHQLDLLRKELER